MLRMMWWVFATTNKKLITSLPVCRRLWWFVKQNLQAESRFRVFCFITPVRFRILILGGGGGWLHMTAGGGGA
ncbi:hypothetical protein HanIR_Chr08g0362391 [Helianthus annuus]|nr:hypothetical protein HanIR_Chr08g0362391 [Helianthus annuus]